MKKITLLLFAFLVATFGFSQNGGDTCATAVVVTPGSFTATTITSDSAGGEMGGGGNDSAWFSYTATADGTIDVESCLGGADTRLYIGTGTCGSLTTVANNDDTCEVTAGGSNFAASLTGVPVTNGTTYYIEWDDRWAEGPFDWTLTYTPPPACGDVAAAFIDTLTDLSLDFSWDMVTVGTPVGYNWEIVADGGTPGNGEDVASGSTDAATTSASSGSVLTASTAYDLYIQTDCGPDGTANWALFNFTTNAGPPPANDTCATAIAVSCGGTYSGDTSLANFEAVGDCGSVDNDAPNVFYTYTGSGSPENVTVSLCGSTYDTSIAVYTGACGALVCLANNDDSCALQSETTFLSDGTTTYYIMVEGFNVGSTGAFDLNVTCEAAATPPANDTCAAAEGLTLNAAAVSGDNTNATSSINNPSCDSFGTISDVWYSFEAPASGNVTVVTTIGSADQANVVVWDDCAFTNELACSADSGGESVDVTGLTAGTTYYIQVWNDGVAAPTQRAEGTFTIAVSETLSTNSFDINAFEYYPNPVNDKLSLRAQSNIQGVSIYNILGQEVVRTAPNAISSDIDMSQLNNGAYFVKVTINDKTETIKIIKK